MRCASTRPETRPGRRPRRPRRADAFPEETCSTAPSSTTANTISRPVIATSRTGSTCRPPSRHRSSPGASTPRRWPRSSIATPATRPRTGRSSRSPRGFTPRSRFTSTASTPRFTAPAPRPGGSAKFRFPRDTKVVTFVARGLESIRGFDLFMQVADRICRQRADVLFVVVGGEEIHYGWDKLHTGSPSFKQWVLSHGELRPLPLPLSGSYPSRAPGRHSPAERPAHLSLGPVRGLLVPFQRDGHRCACPGF